MKKLNIAIVGLGSRGVSLLERIISYKLFDDRLSRTDITLHLFDDGETIGCGIHDANQPEYLLTNTVASQMTMFPDDSVSGIKHYIKGPSFYEWLLDMKKSGHLDANIQMEAYMPRYLLGRYLHWCAGYLIDLARACLNVNVHKDLVIDIDKASSKGWQLKTKNKRVYFTDYVCLTMGHQKEEKTHKELSTGKEIITDLSTENLNEKIMQWQAGWYYGHGAHFF